MWWYNILDNYCNFCFSFSYAGDHWGQQFSLKSQNCLFFVKWISLLSFCSHPNWSRSCSHLQTMWWASRKVVIFTSHFNKFIRSSCGFCELFTLLVLSRLSVEILFANFHTQGKRQMNNSCFNFNTDSFFSWSYKKSPKKRIQILIRRAPCLTELSYFFYSFCFNKFLFCFPLLTLLRV